MKVGSSVSKISFIAEEQKQYVRIPQLMTWCENNTKTEQYVRITQPGC